MKTPNHVGTYFLHVDYRDRVSASSLQGGFAVQSQGMLEQ